MTNAQKYAILAVLAALGLGASASASASTSSSTGLPPAGVWITNSALAEPNKIADELAGVGFSFGNIMLNDFSKQRAPAPFRTHNPDKIVRLAEALISSGLSVDLTTWVMPHEPFIIGMAQQLPQLAEACKADRLWLDAEEPYNRAHGDPDYELAAAEIADALGTAPPLVLSAISFANAAKLGPLAQRCPYWSPQAYATTREGSMKPSLAVPSSLERWRKRFGEPERGYIMGLAGYETTPALLAPPLDASADLAGVCYWAHRAILRDPAVRAYLRSRLSA